MAESKTKERPKQETIIELIDGLLSSGWTSYIDFNLAADKVFKSVEYSNPSSKEACYEKLMEIVGGYYRTNINQAINRMTDAWALVRRGVDIEGILEKEKADHDNDKSVKDKKKPANPIRDEFKRLFIDIRKIHSTDSDEFLSRYSISEATLWYLRNNPKINELSIYRYRTPGYSIFEDLKSYDKERESSKIMRRHAPSLNYDFRDASKYGIIPDPDVISRKRRRLMIRALQDELLRDTSGAVKKRLKEIEHLKKNKPQGWQKYASEKYLNAIYDGKGIMEKLDLGSIIHQYGSHLLTQKDYPKGFSFLEESLKTIREEMMSGNSMAKEEYALILQNLAALHSFLGNYTLAEEETLEGLGVFRELADSDDKYSYGIAIFLNTLAGIHVKMKKFDTVEDEYNEATSLFSRLSDEKPTEYLYMLVECITSLAAYYYFVGRIDDSIEAYERAMPFLDKLTEKNFDDFAPQKVNAMINYSLALQDNDAVQNAEHILYEALLNINDLNERCPNVYDEELSTVFQNLGALYGDNGEIERARDMLLKAEVLRRKLVTMVPNAFTSRLATTLDSMANLDFMTGASDKAIEKWREALSLLSIYDNENNADYSSSLGKYNSSIGMIYLDRGDSDNALEYLIKAEISYRRVFDRNSSPQMFEDNYALTLSYLGVLYESKEETQSKAEDYFEESLDVANWFNSCSHRNDLSYLILICCNYAPYLFNQGRYKEAKQLWERAVRCGEKNRSRLFNQQEQLLLNRVRENIIEADYRIKHPEQEYLDEDDTQSETDISDNDVSNMTFGSYSSEEAIQAIKSASEEITRLNIEDIHYRIKCIELYRKSLNYCSSVPDSLYVANYITSMCQFFAEGYSFSQVLDIAPSTKTIYEDILRKDNGNMKVRLKYVELLSSYCRSLDEYNHNDELYETIDSAYRLLEPINIDEGDDISGTYAALKCELVYDYIFRGYPEEQYKQIKQILTFYRRVSIPSKSLMCRFLTKASVAACEVEEYSAAEKYLEEAEELIKDCDLNDSSNRLCVGEFYTFKGRYIQQTPLKWPDNYAMYSADKAIAAFNQAQSILEGGVAYNPAAFDCKLMELYRSQLMIYRVHSLVYPKELIETCQQLLKVIDVLIGINEYVFSWRSIDAYLDIVDALKEEDFANYYGNRESLEQLEKNCKSLMSMYSRMESMTAIYKKSDSSIYLNYISAITEGKKALRKDFREAMNGG